MMSARSGSARAIAGAVFGACLVAAHVAAERSVRAAEPATEIRALWVLRSSLVSAASIEALVQSAGRHGFNTLVVQVRGRGDAYFAGSSEPRAAELARQPADFDPLAEVLRAGHAAGLRVHAWVNVNLVASAVELPRAREHVVYRHPEWLMVPRDLGQVLSRMDPASPGYIGRLARWTRAQSDAVEGLYASPITLGAIEHLSGVVRSLARRYPVDGVHFDYVRYPNERFDYSRSAIAEFRGWVEPRLEPARRRALAEEARRDLFAFPDALPEEWTRFRTDRMTRLLARIRDAVKSERRSALVSVAGAADLQEARERKFQAWGDWLERGLIDVVCPMAYTTEPEQFAAQIAAAVKAAGERAVWAGIGAYRLSPAQTIRNISTARRLGAAGVILFSYDSLVEEPRDYLAAVARSAFAPEGAAGGMR
jgi:uncharacterized lipoprotein YddW (UPF0748 family)